MRLQHPDTTPTRQHRRRAALGAALTLLLAPLLVLGTASASDAADRSPRKKTERIVEPTSVTVADTTCTVDGDGEWAVTVTFKVTGGRYLNLGAPADAAQALNGDTYDNVRGGGARYVTATSRYSYHPGYSNDGQPLSETDTFTYQHSIAPVTAQRKPLSLRSVRLLSRDIDVTFTCP